MSQIKKDRIKYPIDVNSLQAFSVFVCWYQEQFTALNTPVQPLNYMKTALYSVLQITMLDYLHDLSSIKEQIADMQYTRI